ncbi:secreted RxLR effector protein 161-like [Helianthus annuus]|uniref:secreted RxLR effector protein 161-like n=1 Tax=Helianthus annuus TaxID=4232 RepID=UPI001652F8D6|nr:secreted RxLR effector protein 161-like [Helianthus annuus]
MAECNSANFPMEHKPQLTKEGEGKDVNPTLYQRLIGSLRYLLHTRPDLGYSVGVLSRYMEKPKENHMAAIKQVLRYVKGTIQFGLKYHKGRDSEIVGYSDSRFETDLDDRRGTMGTMFFYSGNLVSWTSQKQRTVVLSSWLLRLRRIWCVSR